MRHFAPKLTLTILTAVALVACGGGGGGSSGGGGAVNNPPTANAGANQTVNGNATVTLNGTASADSDGTLAGYAWTQIAGTVVTLSGGATSQPTFVAPDVAVATTLTFSLIVTDNRFASSSASTVNVVVNPAPNNLPTANAGADQSITAGFIATLNGAASADSDGSVASYAWTQTAGTAVTLSGGTTALPTFTAPSVVAATTLTFSLVVTDNRGGASTADTANVVINPPLAGTTNVVGTVTFVRIPTTSLNGLDYASPQNQPARGVLVRARNTNDQSLLASATTGNNGAYVLNVNNSTPIRIEVVSQMTRTGTLPNWNFRVQNGIVGNAPYVYSDGVSFDSSAVGARNVNIPSGFNAAGAVTGTRASAPFAILDTVYQGVQTILGAAPTTNFPALVLDWEASNPAGETFFTASPIQNIVLSADVAADTDEFDQHVIAHEFGHYVEFNYSRADNIGGGHGLGDKLDIRTAFGEGFGYAFAAIVLNDPIARDTAIQGNNRFTSRFDIDDNPPAPNDPEGCWCSESSVWSILWDVFDGGAEANDTVALGFAPMWSVLTNAQRDTPAFTSIFSFITALKAANPTSATAIDTLVAAQNITTATMDAFGSTETHVPTGVPSIGALPVYANATVGGGAVVLQNINDKGLYNTIGNHRFVKLTVAAAQLVTITVTTSNPNANADPDFQLFRKGVNQIAFPGGQGSSVGVETFPITLQPGIYVLDVYDCANGCLPPDPGDPSNGTPGDYALTVTIN
ncbi:MAG: hypothetical protein ABI821_16575 [Pseudomonadota bacterium]